MEGVLLHIGLGQIGAIGGVLELHQHGHIEVLIVGLLALGLIDQGQGLQIQPVLAGVAADGPEGGHAGAAILQGHLGPALVGHVLAADGREAEVQIPLADIHTGGVSGGAACVGREFLVGSGVSGSRVDTGADLQGLQTHGQIHRPEDQVVLPGGLVVAVLGGDLDDITVVPVAPQAGQGASPQRVRRDADLVAERVHDQDPGVLGRADGQGLAVAEVIHRGVIVAAGHDHLIQADLLEDGAGVGLLQIQCVLLVISVGGGDNDNQVGDRAVPRQSHTLIQHAGAVTKDHVAAQAPVHQSQGGLGIHGLGQDTGSPVGPVQNGVEEGLDGAAGTADGEGTLIALAQVQAQALQVVVAVGLVDDDGVLHIAGAALGLDHQAVLGSVAGDVGKVPAILVARGHVLVRAVGNGGGAGGRIEGSHPSGIGGGDLQAKRIHTGVQVDDVLAPLVQGLGHGVAAAGVGPDVDAIQLAEAPDLQLGDGGVLGIVVGVGPHPDGDDGRAGSRQADCHILEVLGEGGREAADLDLGQRVAGHGVDPDRVGAGGHLEHIATGGSDALAVDGQALQTQIGPDDVERLGPLEGLSGRTGEIGRLGGIHIELHRGVDVVQLHGDGQETISADIGPLDVALVIIHGVLDLLARVAALEGQAHLLGALGHMDHPSLLAAVQGLLCGGIGGLHHLTLHLHADLGLHGQQVPGGGIHIVQDHGVGIAGGRTVGRGDGEGVAGLAQGVDGQVFKHAATHLARNQSAVSIVQGDGCHAIERHDSQVGEEGVVQFSAIDVVIGGISGKAAGLPGAVGAALGHTEVNTVNAEGLGGPVVTGDGILVPARVHIGVGLIHEETDGVHLLPLTVGGHSVEVALVRPVVGVEELGHQILDHIGQRIHINAAVIAASGVILSLGIKSGVLVHGGGLNVDVRGSRGDGHLIDSGIVRHGLGHTDHVQLVAVPEDGNDLTHLQVAAGPEEAQSVGLLGVGCLHKALVGGVGAVGVEVLIPDVDLHLFPAVGQGGAGQGIAEEVVGSAVGNGRTVAAGKLIDFGIHRVPGIGGDPHVDDLLVNQGGIMPVAVVGHGHLGGGIGGIGAVDDGQFIDGHRSILPHEVDVVDSLGAVLGFDMNGVEQLADTVIGHLHQHRASGVGGNRRQDGLAIVRPIGAGGLIEVELDPRGTIHRSPLHRGDDRVAVGGLDQEGGVVGRADTIGDLSERVLGRVSHHRHHISAVHVLGLQDTGVHIEGAGGHTILVGALLGIACVAVYDKADGGVTGLEGDDHIVGLHVTVLGPDLHSVGTQRGVGVSVLPVAGGGPVAEVGVGGTLHPEDGTPVGRLILGHDVQVGLGLVLVEIEVVGIAAVDVSGIPEGIALLLILVLDVLQTVLAALTGQIQGVTGISGAGGHIDGPVVSLDLDIHRELLDAEVAGQVHSVQDEGVVLAGPVAGGPGVLPPVRGGGIVRLAQIPGVQIGQGIDVGGRDGDVLDAGGMGVHGDHIGTHGAAAVAGHGDVAGLLHTLVVIVGHPDVHSKVVGLLLDDEDIVLVRSVGELGGLDPDDVAGLLVGHTGGQAVGIGGNGQDITEGTIHPVLGINMNPLLVQRIPLSLVNFHLHLAVSLATAGGLEETGYGVVLGLIDPESVQLIHIIDFKEQGGVAVHIFQLQVQIHDGRLHPDGVDSGILVVEFSQLGLEASLVPGVVLFGARGVPPVAQAVHQVGSQGGDDADLVAVVVVAILHAELLVEVDHAGGVGPQVAVRVGGTGGQVHRIQVIQNLHPGSHVLELDVKVVTDDQLIALGHKDLVEGLVRRGGLVQVGGAVLELLARAHGDLLDLVTGLQDVQDELILHPVQNLDTTLVELAAGGEDRDDHVGVVGIGPVHLGNDGGHVPEGHVIVSGTGGIVDVVAVSQIVPAAAGVVGDHIHLVIAAVGAHVLVGHSVAAACQGVSGGIAVAQAVAHGHDLTDIAALRRGDGAVLVVDVVHRDTALLVHAGGSRHRIARTGSADDGAGIGKRGDDLVDQDVRRGCQFRRHGNGDGMEPVGQVQRELVGTGGADGFHGPLLAGGPLIGALDLQDTALAQIPAQQDQTHHTTGGGLVGLALQVEGHVDAFAPVQSLQNAGSDSSGEVKSLLGSLLGPDTVQSAIGELVDGRGQLAGSVCSPLLDPLVADGHHGVGVVGRHLQVDAQGAGLQSLQVVGNLDSRGNSGGTDVLRAGVVQRIPVGAHIGPHLEVLIGGLLDEVDVVDLALTALVGHTDQDQLTQVGAVLVLGKVIAENDVLIDGMLVRLAVGQSGTGVGALPVAGQVGIRRLEVVGHVSPADLHRAGQDLLGQGPGDGTDGDGVAHLGIHGQTIVVLLLLQGSRGVLLLCGGGNADQGTGSSAVILQLLHDLQVHTRVGVADVDVVVPCYGSAVLGHHTGHHRDGVGVTRHIQAHVLEDHNVGHIAVGIGALLGLDEGQDAGAVVQSHLGELVVHGELQVHQGSGATGNGGLRLGDTQVEGLLGLRRHGGVGPGAVGHVDIGHVHLDDPGIQQDDHQGVEDLLRTVGRLGDHVEGVAAVISAGEVHEGLNSGGGGLIHVSQAVGGILTGSGTGQHGVGVGLVGGDGQDLSGNLGGLGEDVDRVVDPVVADGHIVVILVGLVGGVHGHIGAAVGIGQGHGEHAQARVIAVLVDPNGPVHWIHSAGIQILEGHINVALVAEVEVSLRGIGGNPVRIVGQSAILVGQRRTVILPIAIPDDQGAVSLVVGPGSQVDGSDVGGLDPDLAAQNRGHDGDVHGFGVVSHSAHEVGRSVDLHLAQTVHVVIQGDEQVLLHEDDVDGVEPAHRLRRGDGGIFGILGEDHHAGLECEIHGSCSVVPGHGVGTQTGQGSGIDGLTSAVVAGGIAVTQELHEGDVLQLLAGVTRDGVQQAIHIGHLVSGQDQHEGVIAHAGTVVGLAVQDGVHPVQRGSVALPEQGQGAVLGVAGGGLHGVGHRVGVPGLVHLEVADLIVGLVELGVSGVHLGLLDGQVGLGGLEQGVEPIPLGFIGLILPLGTESIRRGQLEPVKVGLTLGPGQVGLVGLLAGDGHHSAHIIGLQVDIGVGTGPDDVVVPVQQGVIGLVSNDGVHRDQAIGGDHILEHGHAHRHVGGIGRPEFGHVVALVHAVGTDQSLVVAHQEAGVGVLAVGHQDHQLHPSLVGEFLAAGVVGKLLIDEPDIEVVELVHGHILEPDVGLLGQLGVDQHTVGVDHLEGYIHHSAGLCLGAVDSDAAGAEDLSGAHRGIGGQVGVGGQASALSGLPQGHSIVGHGHDDPKGGGAILIQSDDHPVVALRSGGAVRRDDGQEGVGQPVFGRRSSRGQVAGDHVQIQGA